MFGSKKKRLAAEAEAKEVKKATRTANDKLRQEVKDLKLKLEAQADAHAAANRASARGMAKKDEQIVDLQDTINVLEELHESTVEQQVKSIELEQQETLLKAREGQYESFEAELKTVKEEAKTAAEERYKTGYSDGLADGLRKAHEITAEDRKMSMQVALVAAASHTPGAATEVVKSASKALLGTGKAKK